MLNRQIFAASVALFCVVVPASASMIYSGVLTWDAGERASGVYFIVLETAGQTSGALRMQKALLLK